MQVLWLSHVVPYPPKAGVLLRGYHLLKSVAAQYDVDLIAFVQRPLLATFYSDFEAGLAECRDELSGRCRSVTFLSIERAVRPLGKLRTAVGSLFSGDGYTATWLHGVKATRAIQRAVSEHRYDVAHFDSISVASYYPLLGTTPATLGHHNAESHMMMRRAAHEANLLKRLYFWQEGVRLARYENRIAEWFRLHITCSALDSERLKQTMPRARFIAVPNGVDTRFFAPSGLAQTRNSLVFVGTMNWYPNVDAVTFFLRDVWPLLRAKNAPVTFDIIGAAPPAALKELAARSPGVTLHGYVPEIRLLIERAALYVCPIREGGGTKLKVLEALAMEKCILAHPIACEGINVTPGVDAVFAETPGEFVDQAIELLGDPVRCRAIGEAGRRLAEADYSFSAIGERFTTVLSTVARDATAMLR